MFDPKCKNEYIAEMIDSTAADEYTGLMKEWFQSEYASLIPEYPSQSSSSQSSSLKEKTDSRESFFKRRRSLEGNNGLETSELEVYLSEPLHLDQTEVLSWWKRHSSRFPTVAKMARDFLGVPVIAMSNPFSSHPVIEDPTGNLSFPVMKKVLMTRSWLLNQK
jgi:hypothetical protein